MNLILIRRTLQCGVAALLASPSCYAQLIDSSVSAATYNKFSDWYNRPPVTATDARSRHSAGSVDVNVQGPFSGIAGIAKATAAPGMLHLESTAYLSTFWHNHDGILQWVAGSASTDSVITYSDELTFYTPKLALGAPLTASISLGVSGFLSSFFNVHGVDSAGHGSVQVSLALADAAASYSPTADAPFLPQKLSLVTQVANGSSVPLFLSLAEHTEVESFSDVNHIGAPPGITFASLSLVQYTTLTWAGTDVFSPGGSRLRGTVESASGFDYGRSYFIIAVPEPAMFASAGAGLLSFVLVCRVRRKLRRKIDLFAAGGDCRLERQPNQATRGHAFGGRA